MWKPFVALLASAALMPAADPQARIRQVTRTPGFIALWDFVQRDPQGRFTAHQPPGATADFHLDAINYVHDYWQQGRPATYADFPLLGRGPFGQAIQLRQETDPTFRPCLILPRERLHDTALDVKGPNRSVSMLVWLIRESGNHALAGIWHEGTDLGNGAARVERGKRQYALFAGLAANAGAAAVHVSENGRNSFGDRYARNLAVTPEVLPAVPSDAPAQVLDQSWQLAGFTFDNRKHEVTAYLNGKATEYWIENPQKHPFFQWPAKGWQQAQFHRQPGLQEGEDPSFPADQYYEPPETKLLHREVEQSTPASRRELQTFRYTKVRVTWQREGKGPWRVVQRELVALKANPFWFGHDLYNPRTKEEGGPFTIGRVIHTSKSVGFTGYIGGVAVFDRALTPNQMQRLAEITKPGPIAATR
ncbi:LamG domain-containing protein [Paludibaculum fermentans]|uniref:Uncharacterized protein n=1 Tax=Paludibaculum fermentans TaxID=1473598 RepID=A0A7S7NTX4_PALFE|nr:hypothetical protein [Paludibaculum fermentans]QOY89762.1 hypothetical protein IRI77_07370 [Paludibaculum fermentans]